MQILDEVTLVAYADGELDMETASDVEAALAADPEARALLRNLMESAAMVRTAFTPVLHEPVPSRLVQAVHDTDTGREKNGRRRSSFLHNWGIAIAASAAMLVIGFGSGFAVFGRGALSGFEIADETAAARFIESTRTFNQALENELSGTTVSWAAPNNGYDISVTPVRTFRKSDGGYCREYRLKRLSGQRQELEHGIACRLTGGKWVPRNVVITATADAI